MRRNHHQAISSATTTPKGITKESKSPPPTPSNNNNAAVLTAAAAAAAGSSTITTPTPMAAQQQLHGHSRNNGFGSSSGKSHNKNIGAGSSPFVKNTTTPSGRHHHAASVTPIGAGTAKKTKMMMKHSCNDFLLGGHYYPGKDKKRRLWYRKTLWWRILCSSPARMGVTAFVVVYISVWYVLIPATAVLLSYGRILAGSSGAAATTATAGAEDYDAMLRTGNVAWLWTHGRAVSADSPERVIGAASWQVPPLEQEKELIRALAAERDRLEKVGSTTVDSEPKALQQPLVHRNNGNDRDNSATDREREDRMHILQAISPTWYHRNDGPSSQNAEQQQQEEQQQKQHQEEAVVVEQKPQQQQQQHLRRGGMTATRNNNNNIPPSTTVRIKSTSMPLQQAKDNNGNTNTNGKKEASPAKRDNSKEGQRQEVQQEQEQRQQQRQQQQVKQQQQQRQQVQQQQEQQQELLVLNRERNVKAASLSSPKEQQDEPKSVERKAQDATNVNKREGQAAQDAKNVKREGQPRHAVSAAVDSAAAAAAAAPAAADKRKTPLRDAAAAAASKTTSRRPLRTLQHGVISSTSDDSSNSTLFATGNCPAGGVHEDDLRTTLVIQATLDRVWVLDETCLRWRNDPIIAVVAVTREESLLETTASTLSGWNGDDCPQLQIITYRLSTAEEEKPENYPVNYLRNLALAAVRTSHVLVMDVDFVPSMDLQDTIRAALRERQVLRKRQQQQQQDNNGNNETHDRPGIAAAVIPADGWLDALVVPAFERKAERPCETEEDCKRYLRHDRTFLPHTFEQLRACVQGKQCSVFQQDVNWEGHSSTRSEQWLAGKWYYDQGNNNVSVGAITREQQQQDAIKNNNTMNNVTTATTATTTSYGAIRSLTCIDSLRYEPYVVIRWCPSSSAIAGVGTTTTANATSSANATTTVAAGGGSDNSVAPPPHVAPPPVAPYYDERFHGYGKNKISHVQHLRVAGYRYQVLPKGFIVHNPHVESRAKVRWNDAKHFPLHREMDELYPQFLRELVAIYRDKQDQVIQQCK